MSINNLEQYTELTEDDEARLDGLTSWCKKTCGQVYN